MIYANIVHHLNVMVPHPNHRVLRSGNTYVSVSPSAAVAGARGRNTSRGRSQSRGRGPSTGRGRGAGRSQSTNRGRGRGRSTSARPSSRPPTVGRVAPRASRASSTSARRSAATSRPTPTAAPPVVPDSPSIDRSALRDVMDFNHRGLFDSEDDEEVVEVETPEDVGEEEVNAVNAPLYLPLITRRDLFSPAGRAQQNMFDRMTRSETRDDPNFKLLDAEVSDSGPVFQTIQGRAFECGDAGFGITKVPTKGTGAFLTQPPTTLACPPIKTVLDLNSFPAK